MNDSILMAIESLCDDIASDNRADENKDRSQAVLNLALSGLITPATTEYNEDSTEAEPENETANRKNYPAAGEHFHYNGIEFVALGVEQGGVLAVTAELLEDELPFDKDNCNDWRKSSLRKYLNEEYIKNLNSGDLLPFKSDLTTDSGQKDYGTAEDMVFILSCDLYRKYRVYLPQYNNWWWTITPWHIYPSVASRERVVDTDGSVYSHGAYIGYGVAPACLFNPKIFE